jgi:enoyl-CoA hydratase
MNEYKHLLIRKEGRVAILTLNRAEKMNTFNREVWKEIVKATDEIEEMDDLGAVIITGNGKHFSAGLDVNQLKDGANSETIRKNLPWEQAMYNKLEDFPVPVIAAIQGVCYGSATELVLACDIRIAAKDLRIAIPEVRFGLSPDMGGTTRLPRLVGAGQAKRLILGCEEIDAAEAKSIGLVEIVVEADELMEHAMKLATRIAAMPPMAVWMAKKGINLAAESGRMAGQLFEQAQSVFCCGTEDKQEATKAWLEKRKPEFKGK